MMYKSLFFTGIVFFTTGIINQGIYSGYRADTATEIFAGNGVFNHTAAVPIESILSHPAVQKKELPQQITQAIGYRNERQIHFIVHIKKEQLHGGWQSFYSNKQRCDSGNLKAGLPDGEWKTWYPDGRLKTVRTYSAAKYHLIKADLHRSHPRLQQYRMTQYAQQRKPVQHYFQPVYERRQQLANYNTLLEKIEHNTEGKDSSYLPPFAQALHHGLYMNYHADGTVKDSGHYVNGLKHGIWMESENDGAIRAFGYYDHGYRKGQWKCYDQNNRLLYTDFYKRNGQFSTRHYFE